MSDKLNHFNERGEVHMVDVGDKALTRRRAVAVGRISMQAETLQRILDGDNKKGDVLGVARIAGIMASKKTAELIPLCHPLALSHVDIELETDAENNHVLCRAAVETTGNTGVEMEALTGVNVALLTLFEMCKAIDPGMHMEGVRVLEKKGGKTGHWQSDS